MINIEFQSIHKGVYETHRDVVAGCLLCRFRGQFTNGSMVIIDVNLEDPRGLQIWRTLDCTDDEGHLLRPDSSEEIVQMEQEAGQEAEWWLGRLEKLSQQARVKKDNKK
jgi:hypothetical protein